jgi:hypothetical protein
MKTAIIFLTVLFAILSGISFCQDTGLYIPRNVQRAFDKKTRSIDGRPGINYWQNRSTYNINIDFYPETRLIKGKEGIKYFNNSPDTLKEITIHLFPNIYKKGDPRDFPINPEDESNGVVIERIAYNGKEIDTSSAQKNIEYRGTNLILKLKNPILPNSKNEFSFDWNYILNKGSNVRTGTIDSSTFFIAYFYPHMAVYDDIDGWNDFQYTGGIEFYNDFADYDVSINVPQNFIIRATGVLQNPEEILTDKFLKLYQSAQTSDKVIHIIDSNDVINKNITKEKDKTTWRFKAENVTDFAFGLSDHYLWDGTSLIVDKSTGRRVFIDAAYDKSSKDFYNVVSAARKEIDYMSTVLPGVPFPFPKETIYNGEGGMEYPMMVNDSSEPDSEMVGLTSHEISHSYFPFYMGINESKYAWMDEGWAAFLDFKITSSIFSIETIKNNRLKAYRNAIGNEIDLPIIAISKYLKSPVYRYNSYVKAANFYNILREYLGYDLFANVLKEYINRWNGRHPISYDFFNCISNASGENLAWLIKPWFFVYGYLDLSVKDIQLHGGKYEIIIEKKGIYPAGFKLTITYMDGSSEIISRNVSVWKNVNKSCTIELPSSKKITKAELWDTIWLDADVTNDTFTVQ